MVAASPSLKRSGISFLHPADLAAVLPGDRLIGFFAAPRGWRDSSGTTSTIASCSEIHLLPFLAFLGNWSMGGWSVRRRLATSVLWSVCVEEQFYLIVPLFVAMLAPRFHIPMVVAGRSLTRSPCGGGVPIDPGRGS